MDDMGTRMAELDVEAAALPQLEAEICSWAGRVAAGTCRMLLVLGAFDRRGGWSGLGMASCAHWLAWRCGLSVRAAQDHVAVAHALEALPRIRAEFAAGRLSYSKVRAVARVAEPATEDSWLSHALHCTAGQLERLASRYRQRSADPKEQRTARKVSWSTRSDGLFRLSAVLTAQEGARFVAALEQVRASLTDTRPPTAGDDAPGDPPADGEPAALDTDRRADADALLALAESFLCRPAPGLMGQLDTVTVHVDLATLLDAPLPVAEALPGTAVAARDPSPEAPEEAGSVPRNVGPEPADVVDRLASGMARCDAEPGIGLPRAVLRRLGCDALVRGLLRDGAGNPLALGRRNRVPTRRLREAVYARDQGTCQYPGCGHTRWLQMHHLREWVADGGVTELENLIVVCSRHHRLIHEDGISLRREAGRIVAVLSDGSVVVPAPTLDPGARPAESLADLTADVAADAIHTRDGGRLSWDDSLLVLLQHRDRSVGRDGAVATDTAHVGGTAEDKSLLVGAR